MNIVVTQRENPAEVELEYVDTSYGQEQDSEIKSEDYVGGPGDKPTATLANIRRFRFHPKHDLVLLRHAIETQCFMAPHGRTEAAWTEVQQALKEHLGMHVEVRTLRERFMLLLKKYESGDTSSLKRRGAPQEHDEVEEMLAQVVELKNTYMQQRKLNKHHSPWRDSANGKQRKRVYVTENGETYVTTDMDDSGALNATANEVVEFGGEEVAVDGSASSAKRVRKISLLALLSETHARRKAEVENERLRLEVDSERLRLEAERLRIEEKRIETEAKQREEERKQQAEQFRTLLQTVFDYMKKK